MTSEFPLACEVCGLGPKSEGGGKSLFRTGEKEKEKILIGDVKMI